MIFIFSYHDWLSERRLVRPPPDSTLSTSHAAVQDIQELAYSTTTDAMCWKKISQAETEDQFQQQSYGASQTIKLSFQCAQ